MRAERGPATERSVDGADRRASASHQRSSYSTVMPIERAVPAMIFGGLSMSLALRSAILVSAISRTWS